MLSKNELRELEESRMTPKKLLAIAEELAECATDNPLWRKFGYVAGYVLANVHENDNDPVTPERLVELGFEKHYPENYHFTGVRGRIHYYPRINDGLWDIQEVGAQKETTLRGIMAPRDIADVCDLMERCGAIKE